MMVQFDGLQNSMSSNALDHITIEGFKSIASVELALRPINVLIGANGSGKSNFIGVFDFLHEIREGRLQHYVTAADGAEKLRARQVFCVNGSFFSLRRRLSGRWKSGNPGFGFPLFHRPKVFLVFGVYS